MHEYRIEPLEAVGPVRFGMTRDEVEAQIGRGRELSATRHLYLGSLFVDYDDEGCVEFIEAGQSDKFVVTFHGKDLHALTAEDSVSAISSFAAYDVDDPELGYSFVFPSLQMSLWRRTQDREHFEAVGAGRRGYFEVG